MDLSNVLEMSELLELLKSGKVRDEIKRLESLNEELALQIEIKATLDEAQVIKKAATRDRDEAARELIGAHLEADVLHTQLAKERTEFEEHVRGSFEKIAKESDEHKREYQLACGRLDDRENDLKKREQIATDQIAVAKNKVEWAEQTAAEYRNKLSQLREFVAGKV